MRLQNMFLRSLGNTQLRSHRYRKYPQCMSCYRLGKNHQSCRSQTASSQNIHPQYSKHHLVHRRMDTLYRKHCRLGTNHRFHCSQLRCRRNNSSRYNKHPADLRHRLAPRCLTFVLPNQQGQAMNLNCLKNCPTKIGKVNDHNNRLNHLGSTMSRNRVDQPLGDYHRTRENQMSLVRYVLRPR